MAISEQSGALVPIFRRLHGLMPGYAALIVVVLLMTTTTGVSGVAETKGDSAEPDTLVKETTEQLFEALTDRNVVAADSGARRIVARIVMPHVDFDLVSRWVLGKHWGNATPEQKSRFKEEFRSLLVRTYTNTIISAIDASVEHFPAKIDEEGEAVVRTRVTPEGGQPVSILYRLRRGDGGWKVFDIVVGGTTRL